MITKHSPFFSKFLFTVMVSWQIQAWVIGTLWLINYYHLPVPKSHLYDTYSKCHFQAQFSSWSSFLTYISSSKRFFYEDIKVRVEEQCKKGSSLKVKCLKKFPFLSTKKWKTLPLRSYDLGRHQKRERTLCMGWKLDSIQRQIGHWHLE